VTATGARRARRPLVALLMATALLASACSGDGADGGDRGRGGGNGTGGEPMADVDRLAEAYVTGQPLVVSMRTMQRLGGLVGVNRLFWQTSLSGPSSRVVVAPNRDTLYSIAILDLRSGPMALTLPAITDRYFTYQLLDAWTESFAYVGTRATGGRAGTWVVTPPGWEGRLPDGAERLASSTPLVFLLGRFLVDDEADVANVTALAGRVALEPLASLTGGPAPAPTPPLGDPPGAPQDIPTDATFYDELGDALAVNPPPTAAQDDTFAAVADLGVGAGEHPAAGATGERRARLDDGAAAGDRRIDGAISGGTATATGWSRAGRVGTYGDDTLQRAVVARIGWGANVPEESVYAVARADADGEPLDGHATYRITFPPGGLPPVDAFWSLTAYGEDMFLVENPAGRYAIGDRTPGLTPAADGSLTLALAADEAAAATAVEPGEPVNWLPVPDGPFVLMLRLYLPQAGVLDGSYDYPPVERVR
jgi:hypothetical protein